jgi:NitT/TauT family transport system permease protein
MAAGRQRAARIGLAAAGANGSLECAGRTRDGTLVFYPYILTFQLTPSIVLAPIFIIIFGLGIESKIFVSLTTSFFVILITSLAGFASVDPDSRDLMRVLVASRWTTFRMLTFPTALPFIFTGLRTGIALALIGALVGEFITARAGLGVLLTQFTFNLRQDMVFATIIVIVAFGLTLYGVVEGAHRWLVWWRPEDR